MKLQTRKAMPVHHTGTTDEAWDAAAMLKRMGDEPTAAQLRLMHAWVDPDGEPMAKSSYKLPHHMVSADGSVGAANMKACSSAIGALNGARAEMKIPEADRRAVHNHVAAHMRDGDMEPPEMMSARRVLEQRAFSIVDLEVRAADDTLAEPTITGYAALFDTLSEPLFNFGDITFQETIAPGAFAKTIKEADVRALVNHDPNFVLGRNTAGTLLLAEDKRGLAVTIKPPPTTWAADLLATMRRGDVDQMSFGFQVVKERWTESVDEDGGKRSVIRTVQEVRLFDVSVVAYPAYLDTEAQVRSLLESRGLFQNTEPGESHSVTPPALLEPSASGGHSLAMLRRRLVLAEIL